MDYTRTFKIKLADMQNFVSMADLQHKLPYHTTSSDE
jgi:hypothetical protein